MTQHPASTQSSDQPPSYVAAWITALLLIVVFILGLLMYPPVFEAVKDAP